MKSWLTAQHQPQNMHSVLARLARSGLEHQYTVAEYDTVEHLPAGHDHDSYSNYAAQNVSSAHCKSDCCSTMDSNYDAGPCGMC